MRLVLLGRTPAARLPAIACTGPPSGTPAAPLRSVLGKGSRLPEARAARGIELLLEPFTVPLPAIPVAVDLRQVPAQPRDLPVLLLDARVPRIILTLGREMDKSAIDTPSREIDLRNIPVHLRTALRRALEFEARAPAPRSAEEAEQCEEQLRAIADEFFGALLTPVLQRAVRSAAVGDAASALVRHLPRRMRSDGLETVNVRTSRGTTVPVTTPYYREKHARRAKRRPGLYPALVVLGIYDLWVATCMYLLLAYLKFVLRLSWSLHQMLRVLQLNLFDRRPLAELFTTPSPPGSPDPQMLLWR